MSWILSIHYQLWESEEKTEVWMIQDFIVIANYDNSLSPFCSKRLTSPCFAPAFKPLWRFSSRDLFYPACHWTVYSTNPQATFGDVHRRHGASVACMCACVLVHVSMCVLVCVCLCMSWPSGRAVCVVTMCLFVLWPVARAKLSSLFQTQRQGLSFHS